jgi:allophanate hydrolase
VKALSAAERSLAAVEASDRLEVWISRFEPDEILTAARRIDEAAAAGGDLPLAGMTFAVKDNIDVAGLATTAGCPAYAYRPTSDAPAVEALVQAGALCIGKTNLDQFATGLVGTRSPYGAVRCAVDPRRISGGSSSGSAVAVALGLVDVALGTDTAGSGRVPAALNGIVGLKGTVGTVSTRGVVPACRSFDCVTVFAREVTPAEAVLAQLTGPAGWAPDRRAFPTDMALAPPQRPTIAVPDEGALGPLPPGWLDAFRSACAVLEASGCALVPLDLEPFLLAGQLLYGGAFVAERYAAVGAFVDAHLGEVDPTVGAIISGAAGISATELVDDQATLAMLAGAARAAWEQAGADALLLPTTTGHPTMEEVAADPVGVNIGLGRFTTFLNMLDMCAVAVPAGNVGGLPFGVSCIGPAFSELMLLELARRLEGQERGGPARTWQSARRARLSPPAAPIAVVGAHLTGQPLNSQLTDRGARLLGTARTAPCYRMHALPTEPPKPGLRRVQRDGTHIELEIWELAPSRFGDFVASVPPPMTIGTVILEDGSSVPGFLCEPVALQDAPDISVFGGWRRYLGSAAAPSPEGGKAWLSEPAGEPAGLLPRRQV